uniref:catechol O-methyltransferase n=2 Tax=Leptobrachium leishanense TaxID=445787 RepID=A0A8C5PWK4_9ANUR
MITVLVTSSSYLLLAGVPLCMGMAWILYKYRSRNVEKLVLDVKTQQALRRYVLLESVHGKPDSVLLTYKEYAKRNRQIERLIFTEEQELFFADAIKNSRPITALLLGTQCGYSAIQLLARIPPNGKVYAVEQNEILAESAEEMILVSGFKNHQFAMLFQPPLEAIIALVKRFDLQKVDLVLMDQQPIQYLENFLALEKEGILHPGTLILVNHIEQSTAKAFMDYLQSYPHRIMGRCQGLVLIQCVGERESRLQ